LCNDGVYRTALVQSAYTGSIAGLTATKLLLVGNSTFNTTNYLNNLNNVITALGSSTSTI